MQYHAMTYHFMPESRRCSTDAAMGAGPAQLRELLKRAESMPGFFWFWGRLIWTGVQGLAKTSC